MKYEFLTKYVLVLSPVLFFSLGIFVAGLGQPEYIASYPITILAPHRPDTMLFFDMLDEGTELHCFWWKEGN